MTNLADGLALELGDELLDAGSIGLNSDGRENGRDVLGGRRGVTAEGEEKVGSEELHCAVFGGVSNWSEVPWSRGIVQVCI